MLGLLMPISSFLMQKTDDMVDSLAAMYPDADSSQTVAWKTLLSDMANADTIRNFPGDCLIGFEYSLPTDGMAIDCLIAGRNIQGEPVAFLIESKQWNDSFIKNTNFSFHRTDECQLHPQVQISRHKLSFSAYLDIGPLFKVTPCVFLRNCSEEGLHKLASENMDPGSQTIKMYRNIDDLLNIAAEEIVCGLPTGVELLSNADYTPSRGIIDAMSSIVSREPPFILTPEQKNITGLIRENIANGKKIIRVTGAAGAGKTAILLNLYISLLNEMTSTGIKPIFVSGAQNTAYYQSKFPEVRNSFTYSFSLDKMAGPRSAHKKIILMDEAQHNQSGIITNMAERGATLILCYDIDQIINADNALKELAELEQRNDFVSLQLHDSVRFNGSDAAENNIKKCLRGETSFAPDDKFDFQCFRTLSEFQDKILETIKNHPHQTVAVTGLLSSDADDFTIKNNPNSILFTDWKTPNRWEKAECRWMPYVTNKNYLAQNNGNIWVGTW